MEYVPGAQAVHALAPAPETYPVPHGEQADDDVAPVTLPNVPATHDMHTEAPLVFAYVPAGHNAHVPDDVAPVALEKEPGAHALHTDAPDVLVSDPPEHASATFKINAAAVDTPELAMLQPMATVVPAAAPRIWAHVIDIEDVDHVPVVSS